MGANLSQSWPFSLCAWIRRFVWYLKWHYLCIWARSKYPLTDKATWIYSGIIHFAVKWWFENYVIMEDKASAAPLLALCREFCCFFVPSGGHSLWNWCLGNVREHGAAGASTGVHTCGVFLAAKFSFCILYDWRSSWEQMKENSHLIFPKSNFPSQSLSVFHFDLLGILWKNYFLKKICIFYERKLLSSLCFTVGVTRPENVVFPSVLHQLEMEKTRIETVSHCQN